MSPDEIGGEAPPALNPYLELWRELGERGASEELRLALRKKLIWAYSWAIPGEEAVRELVARSPLVEMGAGTGYWAWVAEQAGADVVAYDRNAFAPPHWREVEEGGPVRLARHPDRALLMVWPPLDDAMAEKCLEVYRGDTVIYVGEWRGRTASARFHDRLEREFRLERAVEIPRWPGFGDELRVYARLR